MQSDFAGCKAKPDCIIFCTPVTNLPVFSTSYSNQQVAIDFPDTGDVNYGRTMEKSWKKG